MPTPLWQQKENALKCQRTCEVCGGRFTVKYPSKTTRTCSTKCQGVVITNNQLGRKHTEETRKRRSESLAAFNSANPQLSRARVDAAKQAGAAWLSDPSNADRIAEKNEISRRLMREINERNGDQNRIIMKRAHQELRAETDYCLVFTEVQETLRREMPYDGPKEGSDYVEYLHKLGRATAQHPRLTEIARQFMAEAIPRITKDVKAAIAMGSTGRDGETRPDPKGSRAGLQASDDA